MSPLQLLNDLLSSAGRAFFNEMDEIHAPRLTAEEFDAMVEASRGVAGEVNGVYMVL